jgi:uncharacterized protein (TIGR02118 family)
MVKITVLYGQPTDPEAFERYYPQHNARYASREAIPGALKIDLSRSLPALPGQAPFYRATDVWFETLEDALQALATPTVQQGMQDFQHYATGGTQVAISEVQTIDLMPQEEESRGS